MTTKGEIAVEKEDRVAAKAEGWFCAKIVSPGLNGMPDRLYGKNDPCSCCGRSPVVFMEWKKTGKDANAQQAKRHREMREAGFVVIVVESVEQAKRVRATLLRGC